MCVWLGVIEIFFIIAMVQSSKSFSASDDTGGTASSIASAGIGVLLVLDLLIVAGFAVVILYYSKIVASINAIKGTINSGNPDDRVSVYVAVLTFISAGFKCITVFFASGALSVLSTLCSAASAVCFGIIILKYRDYIRSHINGNCSPQSANPTL